MWRSAWSSDECCVNAPLGSEDRNYTSSVLKRLNSSWINWGFKCFKREFNFPLHVAKVSADPWYLQQTGKKLVKVRRMVYVVLLFCVPVDVKWRRHCLISVQKSWTRSRLCFQPWRWLLQEAPTTQTSSPTRYLPDLILCFYSKRSSTLLSSNSTFFFFFTLSCCRRTAGAVWDLL